MEYCWTAVHLHDVFNQGKKAFSYGNSFICSVSHKDDELFCTSGFEPAWPPQFFTEWWCLEGAWIADEDPIFQCSYSDVSVLSWEYSDGKACMDWQLLYIYYLRKSTACGRYPCACQLKMCFCFTRLYYTELQIELSHLLFIFGQLFRNLNRFML